MSSESSYGRYPELAASIIELGIPTKDLSPHEMDADITTTDEQVSRLITLCREMGSAEGKKSVWPSISRVGAEAAHAAWRIFLHCDDHPDIQSRSVELMQEEAPEEVEQPAIAYLTDRWLINSVRCQDEPLGLQNYGTQLEFIADWESRQNRLICTFAPIIIREKTVQNQKPKLWRAQKFENIDLERLDKRRAQYGLGSFEKFVNSAIQTKRKQGHPVTAIWNLGRQQQKTILNLIQVEATMPVIHIGSESVSENNQ